MVNDEMPWNPMRDEQRIGRIDRLEQPHSSIRIINLHYEGTVETDVYRARRSRIGLLQSVIGRLQPILAQLPWRFCSAPTRKGGIRPNESRSDTLSGPLPHWADGGTCMTRATFMSWAGAARVSFVPNGRPTPVEIVILVRQGTNHVPFQNTPFLVKIARGRPKSHRSVQIPRRAQRALRRPDRARRSLRVAGAGGGMRGTIPIMMCRVPERPR